MENEGDTSQNAPLCAKHNVVPENYLLTVGQMNIKAQSGQGCLI